MGKKKSKKPKSEGPSSNKPPTLKKKLGKKKKKSSKKLSVGPIPTGVAGASSSNAVVGSGSAGVLESVPSSNVEVRMNVEGLQGFIFMCNSKTKFDCYRFRVFGLPRGQFEVVKKIGPGAMLFLFDTDLKLLYGVYEASSGGDLRLEPGAFDGRFPAQVKFHIFKDCLPLHERVFKHVIRENYSGNKFKQELSSTQVNNLILLFHPIPSGLPASAGASLRDVEMPQFSQSRFLDENSPMSTRHPHPKDLYLSRSVYPPALPRLDHQSVRPASHPLYAHSQMEAHGLYLQQSTGLRHVQQPAPHRTSSYYPADAHQPYLPDDPLLYSQDPYRRYGVAPHSYQQSRADAYQTGSRTSLLPREQEIGVQPGYVADHSSQSLAPVAASRIPVQVNSLVQQHTAPQATYVQTELPASYLAYYAVPSNQAASLAYVDPNQIHGPQSSSLPDAYTRASYYSDAGGNPNHH